MSHTTFKGIDSISEPSINEAIRDNIISFLDWGFLEIGAFYNINIATSGAYGGNRAVLRRVNDPRYTTGTVWEGQRKNWIWETELERADKPIAISGLFINNVFFPINSGYYIDYPNGRVVFNSPVPANSSVKIEHSYKLVQVIDSDLLPDVTQIQARSFRADDSNIAVNSGQWQRLADTRVQLPVICVNVPDRKTYKGFQLGGGSWAKMDVLLDVVGEDKAMTSRIANIISNQNEKTIFVYDTERLASDNKYPLDYRGSPIPSALNYPQLVSPTGDGGYRYIDKIQNSKLSIIDAEEQGTKRTNNNVFHCPVNFTIELILNDI